MKISVSARIRLVHLDLPHENVVAANWPPAPPRPPPDARCRRVAHVNDGRRARRVRYVAAAALFQCFFKPKQEAFLFAEVRAPHPDVQLFRFQLVSGGLLRM